MAEETINGDLHDLQGTLADQVQNLHDELGDVSTIDEARAIQGEITELNHRVTTVGNLLFTQQTARITQAMDRVRDATADANKATKTIGEISDFLKTMSSFLALVDKVIDVAKVVALA
jgi:hypothetical protein